MLNFPLRRTCVIEDSALEGTTMKNVRKNFLSLAMAGWLLGFAAPAAAEPFAYVANHGSHNVTVIDTATNGLVTTIPVGNNPVGAAITPDGAFAYG